MNLKKYSRCKLTAVLCLFFCSAFALSAQTASELDLLLATDPVTTATAARFILGAAELLPSALSGAAAESEAYALALSKGWVKKPAEESITLKETAFLIMNAFRLKGGVMFSLFRNSRYAYRETRYRIIIQGRSDPGMKLSGQRLLQIIGRALSISGDPALSGGAD